MVSINHGNILKFNAICFFCGGIKQSYILYFILKQLNNNKTHSIGVKNHIDFINNDKPALWFYILCWPTCTQSVLEGVNRPSDLMLSQHKKFVENVFFFPSELMSMHSIAFNQVLNLPSNKNRHWLWVEMADEKPKPQHNKSETQNLF